MPQQSIFVGRSQAKIFAHFSHTKDTNDMLQTGGAISDKDKDRDKEYGDSIDFQLWSICMRS